VPVAPLRWTTIVVTVGLALFNIVALPYKGFYDNLLIAVSFLINALIAWQAWTWEAPAG
jgi:hypothetical protein